MCRYNPNRLRKSPPTWSAEATRDFEADDISLVHQSIPEYAPTPLVHLSALAEVLGVEDVLVKDESHRFGLKAFKALGATYAVYKWLSRQLRAPGLVLSPEQLYGQTGAIPEGRYTFCTATDGNHGRGVAWVARKIHQQAVIYMPSDSVEARIRTIEAEGADVRVVDGHYDEAVARMSEDAAVNGWTIISDTSWPGYREVPQWIQAGYRTMFEEIEKETAGDKPDLVLIPGGVGALAATAAWFFNRPTNDWRPRLVCVEPTAADCLYQSSLTSDGSTARAGGSLSTIMAGLNCASVSPVAWPWIRDGFDGFLAITDRYAAEGMRRYYRPVKSDTRIVSGESGAATLGGLLALLAEEKLEEARKHLGLGSHTRVLLISTEGDTDPAGFRRVVSP